MRKLARYKIIQYPLMFLMFFSATFYGTAEIQLETFQGVIGMVLSAVVLLLYILRKIKPNNIIQNIEEVLAFLTILWLGYIVYTTTIV